MVEPALIDGCLFTGDSEMVGDGQIAAVGGAAILRRRRLGRCGVLGGGVGAHRVGV